MNSTITDEIMSSVHGVLAKSGFLFTNDSSKIITGEEEGSCGWITVNYLKKVLQEKNEVNTLNLFCGILFRTPFIKPPTGSGRPHFSSSQFSLTLNDLNAVLFIYLFSLIFFYVFKEDIKESSGALDLGGASTQITFVPRNTSFQTSLQHFKLYGKDYPVYTKTYLCYGLNEIFRRFLAQLAKVRKKIKS